MGNYTEIFNRGNEYFDTYHIKNEQGKYIGILEDHCRGVKQRYFVGWNFGGNWTMNPNQAGNTKSFDNKENALNFIAFGK